MADFKTAEEKIKAIKDQLSFVRREVDLLHKQKMEEVFVEQNLRFDLGTEKVKNVKNAEEILTFFDNIDFLEAVDIVHGFNKHKVYDEVKERLKGFLAAEAIEDTTGLILCVFFERL